VITFSDALVGFMRSVAARVRGEAIRVNAICPGMVKTNLGGGESFEDVQHQLLVPMEYLVDVTLLLLDGREMIDAKGTRISALEAWGRAVEISGTNYYFREQLEWPDDKMQTTLSETFLAV
jgi:NAD(P)-dependent dehydrogenase (short-subunit alcohol dehydrogenase family)